MIKSNNNYLAGMIYAILGVFILQLIVRTFFTNVYLEVVGLFGINMSHFSFWQLVTYSFFHYDFLHLISNLILLYFIGDLFLQYFTKYQFLAYFFIGGIVGGLFYYFGYDYLVVKSSKIPLLLGASASINTLLVALTVKKPKLNVYLKLIGNIKLYVITIVILLLNLITFQGTNIGGVLAHLGGAFTGFILVILLDDKKTMPIFKKKSPLKVVYKEESFGQTNYQKQRIKQNKIDNLLEKINKSGYDSLSADEKAFLKEASKD